MMKKSIYCFLMFILILQSGCKKSQYTDPANPHCIEAFNALNNDDAEALKRQLDQGVSPDVCLYDGTPIIHSAAYRGCRNCIKALIDAGANIDIVNAEGQNALHTVIPFFMDNKLEIAKLLLDSGIDVCTKDANGNTAYSNAIANDEEELASLIEARLKELGVKSEDVFTEISAIPDRVSIKTVKGTGNSSSTIGIDGRYIGKNVTLLDVWQMVPHEYEYIFDLDNLPQDRFWIEVKGTPDFPAIDATKLKHDNRFWQLYNESDKKSEKNWPLLKEAFEKTFDIKFVEEKQPTDVVIVTFKTDQKDALPASQENGEFDENWQDGNVVLTHCTTDNLCSYVAEKRDIEHVNETNIQGQYDFVFDVFEDKLLLDLEKIGFRFEETQQERLGLAVKKTE